MNDTPESLWRDDERLAYEVWQHYRSVGEADKDTMIKIVTWLLGFSAGIIGVFATGKLEPRFASVVMVLGMVLSLLAAFTALLYGGYATRNWYKAEQIAEQYGGAVVKREWPPEVKYPWTSALPLWLSKPSHTKVARVFWLFFLASLISFGVQTALFLRLL